MTEEQQQSCLERVQSAWQSRRDDLEAILYPNEADPDELEALGFEDPEDASLAEYGLAFDYVPAGTFSDQDRGYFRYQLSWGGPSEEIRFYADYGGRPYLIEFWYLDWFDGAPLPITHDEIVGAVWDWFDGLDAPAQAYQEATE